MKETMSGRIIKQAALQRHLKTMVDRDSSCRNRNLADDAIDMLLRDDPQLDYSIGRTNNLHSRELDNDPLAP